VASLTNELFSYGTHGHDRLGFQKALDDISATEQAGPRFELKVLTPQFEAGMKLLAENELHPAFPADAFPIVQRQLAQGLAGQLQSPDYREKRALVKALVPAGDPALREATPKTVMALTPEALRAFYQAAYRPDLTTIVVAGDVTQQQAQKVVSETFGGWQAAGPTPRIDSPRIGANPPSAAHVPDATSLQDSVTLAHTVQIEIANPDRYTLMLGNTILGGGFFSRLYRDLRIKTGYVYSVDSELSWNRTRSDYSASFGCDPQNVPKARALLVQDIKDMQAKPVSDTELTRAKAQMLRRLPMQRDSINGIGALYLRLADLGLPLDSPQKGAERIFSSTAADIQKAFATYLRPDGLVQVVKGPAPGL
jgi:zinc protease